MLEYFIASFLRALICFQSKRKVRVNGSCLKAVERELIVINWLYSVCCRTSREYLSSSWQYVQNSCSLIKIWATSNWPCPGCPLPPIQNESWCTVCFARQWNEKWRSIRPWELKLSILVWSSLKVYILLSFFRRWSMATTSNLLNRTPHGNGMLKNWQGVLSSTLLWKLNIERLISP